MSRLLGRSFEKVTFAGGEPTLCPWITSLIQAAKQEGATTNLVTNGSLLSERFLDTIQGSLDWITSGIDSASEATHATMGRKTKKGPIALERYRTLARSIKARGHTLKVNTVVTSENAAEDLSELLIDLAPTRWKIFQVLPVTGQNDDHIDELRITESTFKDFIKRHQGVERHGITLVPETTALLRGSYAMVDPAGRFYDSTAGGHTYSKAILQTSLEEAWREVQFSHELFESRGGRYQWS